MKFEAVEERPVTSAEKNSIVEEKVKSRAYAIWEDEGRPEGKHLEHWERARREAGASKPTPAPAAAPQAAPRRNGKGKA